MFLVIYVLLVAASLDTDNRNHYSRPLLAMRDPRIGAGFLISIPTCMSRRRPLANTIVPIPFAA